MRPQLVQQATPEGVDVELESGLVTKPRQGRTLFVILGVAVLAAVSVAAVSYATKKPPQKAIVMPPVQPVKPRPPEPEPPKLPPIEGVVVPGPVMVTFEVNSNPEGASVALDGKNVGTTPFTMPLKADPDGNLRIQLQFTLEGYQSMTVTAEGRGTVEVNPALKRKPGAQTPPGKKRASPKDPCFKDDPYQ
jgi:hypothetical protein